METAVHRGEFLTFFPSQRCPYDGSVFFLELYTRLDVSPTLLTYHLRSQGLVYQTDRTKHTVSQPVKAVPDFPLLWHLSRGVR